MEYIFRSIKLTPTTKSLKPWPICFLLFFYTYKLYIFKFYLGLPWWLSSKESTCQYRRNRFNPWVGKIPRRRKWQLSPGFLLGQKSHGQKSLVSHSPWACKESDTTQRLRLLLLSHFSRVRLCATPKTAAHQAPPSLGFSSTLVMIHISYKVALLLHFHTWQLEFEM